MIHSLNFNPISTKWYGSDYRIDLHSLFQFIKFSLHCRLPFGWIRNHEMEKGNYFGDDKGNYPKIIVGYCGVHLKTVSIK